MDDCFNCKHGWTSNNDEKLVRCEYDIREVWSEDDLFTMPNWYTEIDECWEPIEEENAD